MQLSYGLMTQPPDGVLSTVSRANRQPLPKPRTAHGEGLQCAYVEVDERLPRLAFKTQAVTAQYNVCGGVRE